MAIRLIGTRLLCFIYLGLLLLLIGSGCAPKPVLVKRGGKIQGLEKRFKPGDIVRLPQGEIISFAGLIKSLRERDVVFVGEVHNDPDHHLIQTQILQALALEWGRINVAMEFLPVHTKDAVKRYLTGEINEEEFLKQVNWDKIWGFPYHLYRPMFLVAKREGGQILPINAPNRIVKKVARTGLESLTQDEKRLIAREIDLSHPGHRNYLKEVFESHHHGEIKDFEYFYQAQCVWEDTMAENIAAWLAADNRCLVVLAGNGHVLNRYGIPDRVLKRVQADTAIVVPIHFRHLGRVRPDSADFVWVTGRRFRGLGTKKE